MNKIFYLKPAKKWTEALPLGNGRIGAMIFGQIQEEHIQLNEDTLWSGDPADRDAKIDIGPLKSHALELIDKGRYAEVEKLIHDSWQGQPAAGYQPFGDIYLDFKKHEKIENYRRELDLDRAIALTEYTVNEVQYRREYFISAPADLMVIRLTSSAKCMNFSINFSSKHSHVLKHEGDALELSGQAPGLIINRTEDYVLERNHQKFYPPLWDKENNKKAPFKTAFYGEEVDNKGMHFCGIAKIKSDGKIQKNTVSDASECIIFVSLGTSFTDYKTSPAINGESLALDKALLPLNNINSSYQKLLAEHANDYQAYFNRSDIMVAGQTAQSKLPTDERIELFANGNDMDLISLYYQFGRYLMISGSRPGSQALNLQGIWNDSVNPPWFSAYTVNINTEMNYWPAESANLSECHEPMLRFIEECAERGKEAAEKMYHCNGWVSSHNTDIWRSGQSIEGPPCCFWQAGAGWLCQHLWTHYEYTLDVNFLSEKAYPVMRRAAEFYLDWMIENENGMLITPISESPESKFLYIDENGEKRSSCFSQGCTMDMTVIAELFSNCVEASSILSRDYDFKNILKQALDKINPFKISSGGYLQEWETDFEDQDIHHRHVSHLYGLYPGKTITPETPDLFEAARLSLERRGDMATGWSMGWKINLWARLQDGDHALTMIKKLLSPERTYPNMFDAHPPFQIDGNFGAVAGIVEMLVQCRNNIIYLLPALPDAWSCGKFKGLCCPGGLELDAKWKDGKITFMAVKSKFSGNYKFIINNKKEEVFCIKNKQHLIQLEECIKL